MLCKKNFNKPLLIKGAIGMGRARETYFLRQSQTNSKKIYAIDNGLVVANTFNMSANMGKLLVDGVKYIQEMSHF